MTEKENERIMRPKIVDEEQEQKKSFKCIVREWLIRKKNCAEKLEVVRRKLNNISN